MKRHYAPKIAEASPHCVEWMFSPEAEEYEFAYFSSLKGAQPYAEEKVSQKVTVWVAEIGDYLDGEGELVRSWMYCRWDQSADWGEVEGRGKSYRSATAKRLVDYTPIDKTDWKG